MLFGYQFIVASKPKALQVSGHKSVEFGETGATMGLISLLLVLFDPFGIIRNYIMKPATDVLFGAYSFYKDKTANSVLSAREVIIRLGIIMFAGSVIIWTAIFMYIAFYYTYMPAIAHMRPVNMQFE